MLELGTVNRVLPLICKSLSALLFFAIEHCDQRSRVVLLLLCCNQVIDGRKFVDGGLGFNNPSLPAFKVR